jgi:hypothetical protein
MQLSRIRSACAMFASAVRSPLGAKTLGVAVLTLLAVPGGAVTYLFTDSFPLVYRLYDGQTSPDGNWYCAWTGYGEVATELASNNLALKLRPMGAVKAGETHSSLAYSTRSFTDAVFDVDVRTVEQLRLVKRGQRYLANPNTWEVAWVLWRVANASNFYYFMVKPNGTEFGRVVGGAQQILVTTATPKLTIGAWDHWTVRVVGNRFTMSVNYATVLDVTDLTPPPILASGAFGLYCEDAYVQFDNVVVATP